VTFSGSRMAVRTEEGKGEVNGERKGDVGTFGNWSNFSASFDTEVDGLLLWTMIGTSNIAPLST
jgi:hypothetical protein